MARTKREREAGELLRTLGKEGTGADMAPEKPRPGPNPMVHQKRPTPPACLYIYDI